MHLDLLRAAAPGTEHRHQRHCRKGGMLSENAQGIDAVTAAPEAHSSYAQMLNRRQDRSKGNALGGFALVVQLHTDHHRQAGLPSAQNGGTGFGNRGDTVCQQQAGTQTAELKALLRIAGREIPDAPGFVVLIAEGQAAGAVRRSSGRVSRSALPVPGHPVPGRPNRDRR